MYEQYFASNDFVIIMRHFCNNFVSGCSLSETVPGRVRVNFAQNGGHEKARKKPRKRPKHCFSRQKRATKKATEKPRKSHEKVTSKNATSNEKSSELALS